MTKTPKATAKRMGGHATGKRAMSNAERQRRYRERHRGKGTVRTCTMKPEAERSQAETVFDSLCEAHRIETAHGRALAWRIANALVSGGTNNLSEAVKAIALLPPAKVQTRAERTISAQAAKQRLGELIENNRRADHVELARRVRRGEPLSAVEAATLRLYEAEAVEAGREVEPVKVESAVASTMVAVAPMDAADAVVHACTTERVITPPTGDIVPPGERTDRPPDPPLREPKPPTVIDVKAVPVPASPTGPNWDASENAAKWRAWRERNPDADVLLW